MERIIHDFKQRIKKIDRSARLDEKYKIMFTIGQHDYEIDFDEGLFFLNGFSIDTYSKYFHDYQVPEVRHRGFLYEQFEYIKKFQLEEDEEEKKKLEDLIDPVNLYISNFLTFKEYRNKLNDFIIAYAKFVADLYVQPRIKTVLHKKLNDLYKNYNFHYIDFSGNRDYDIIVDTFTMGAMRYYMIYEIKHDNDFFRIEDEYGDILNIDFKKDGPFFMLPDELSGYGGRVKAFTDDAYDLYREVKLLRKKYPKQKIRYGSLF